MRTQVIVAVASSLLLIGAGGLVESGRQASGRRLEAGEKRAGFHSPCGTADEVSVRVGKCLVEIFDLIEGRFGDPKNDADLLGHCERFSHTEKCIRSVSKDCLSGIHKTATSAVASATKRFRTNECRTPALRSRYSDPLKCAIKIGNELRLVFRNHTGIMQGIRDLPDLTPEEKLVKMCCTLNNLDRELENRLNRNCPASTTIVMSIVNAMTQDARTTLCVNPKCNHALDRVIKTTYKPPQNFIEPVAQILYMLNVD